MIPLSLYIHIPWCVKKCPYCDFNSHQFQHALPEKEYVTKLIYDLERELPSIWGRKVKTIFFGGGTPSLFSPSAMEYLLQQLNALLAYSPDIEITLEANPGTVEQQKFAAFKNIGINRISLGVQSFQEDKLVSLGRIHNGQEAERAIESADRAGFSNFNIDLMFGLPNQTLADALFDLEKAISLKPKHISWYQLTIEPHTHFASFPPKLPNDDYIWEIQQQGQALLASAGFHQYEVSAYSLSNYQCEHNRNYWEFGDYVGIGAGAHSKITDMNNHKITRIWKIKHPKYYLANAELVAGTKEISSNDLPLEFMLNALRLFEPIKFDLFEERTGLAISCIEKQLQKATRAGLVTLDDHSMNTTPLGKLFLNDLLEIFSA